MLQEVQAERRVKPFVPEEVRLAEEKRTAALLRMADEVVSAPKRTPLPRNPIIGLQENGEINFTRIGSKKVRTGRIEPTRLA